MSKELYEDIIRVIDILKEQTSLTDSRGEKIFGSVRWSKVRQWIDENHGTAIFCSSGIIQKRNLPTLEAMRSNCEEIITRINREEEDRELNNAYLKGQNVYAKRAFIISIIALIVSMAAVAATVLSATVWK